MQIWALGCIGGVLLLYTVWTFSYYRSPYFSGTHLPYFHVRLQRGRWGEYCMFRAANTLTGEKMWMFNLYLPKADRATTEVDAVLLHESGFYVFESKNLRGEIRGTSDARTWTQTTADCKQIMFYNPLMQNDTHCKQVVWRIPRAFVRSIIVFGKNATLADVPREHGIHAVCSLRDLPARLAELAARTPHQHSEHFLEVAYGGLSVFTFPPRAVRRYHKERIARSNAVHAASPEDRTEAFPFEIPPPGDEDAPPV